MADKTRLFNIYSQNLTFIKQYFNLPGDFGETQYIACPLCLQLLTQNDFVTRQLTAEHVPPEMLGGEVRALTCQSCNNDLGSKLDAAWIEDVRNPLSLGQKSSLHRAKAFVNEYPYAIPIEVFQVNDSHVWLKPFYESKSPHIERIDNVIATEGLNKIRLLITLPAPHLKQLALLKTAYLIGFSIFGYAFLVNDNLKFIREQLRNFSNPMLQKSVEVKGEFPDTVLGVNVVTISNRMSFYLIIFDAKVEAGQIRYSIILPLPLQLETDIYTKISEIEGKPFNANFINLSANYFRFSTEPLALVDMLKALNI